LLDGRSHQPASAALELLLHPLLASDPALTRRTLKRWSRSADLWLRRAAIVAQVHAGEATDVALLLEVIEPAIEEKAVFLRKAIGWALRALAKHTRLARK